MLLLVFLRWLEKFTDFLLRPAHVLVEDLRAIYDFWFLTVKCFGDLSGN
jgi:hypothetical protein